MTRPSIGPSEREPGHDAPTLRPSDGSTPPAGGGVSPLPKNQLAGNCADLLDREGLESVEDDGSAQTPELSCLARRADALVIAFALESDVEVLKYLWTRRDLADRVGKVELVVSPLVARRVEADESARGDRKTIGGAEWVPYGHADWAAAIAEGGPGGKPWPELRFELKQSSQRGAYYFVNNDARCAFRTRNSPKWPLEVTLRASYLATHTIAEAVNLATRIACSFGAVRGYPRLRRVDLCADFTGFPILPSDRDRIVTTRSKTGDFVPEAKDTGEVTTASWQLATREFRNSTRRITGVSISAGNPLSERLYLKTEELRIAGREEKREIEYGIWRANGWNGVDEVTRVELQARGRALDEFKLRDARALDARLDELWQYGAKWARIVVPTEGTRMCRCPLDPRWEAVKSVVFTHKAMPAQRTRLRGGATAMHVLGAQLSRAGSLKKLTRAAVSDDGECLDEMAWAAALAEDAARQWRRDRLEELGKLLVDDLNDELERRFGKDASLALALRINATIARFTSSDDADGPRGPSNQSGGAP